MPIPFGERRLWPQLKDIPLGVQWELIHAGGGGLFVEVFADESITAEELDTQWVEFCNMIDHIRDSAN